MESWSHSPVKEFKTQFFVDTNILCYLTDNTYASLNKFITCFKDSPFVELISSEYVLLEFIGVRKKEHYLREAVTQTQAQGKQINMCSMLKDYDRYSLREMDFYTLLPSIKNKVDAEKDEISSNFGISFNCGFHQDLFNPTSDVCLSTKISREDSLVLISSIIPKRGETNENVILLTNDSDFKKWYTETNIDHIFELYSIPKPEIHGISTIKGEQTLNLFQTVEDDEIERHVVVCLHKILRGRLSDFYMGITFTPTGDDFPNDCLCFETLIDKSITNNKYLTIIGKNLDFVYNTETAVSFWNNGQRIADEGFIATEGNSYLSFKVEIDDANPEKGNILAKLKEEGNLIFVHPDN
jgi:hypothetical protein